MIILLECRMRSLASIYPFVNVITSTSLLTPLFQALDSYNWYPISFTHTVLKAFSGSKSKEAYSKPTYLHVITHVADLLPMIAEVSDVSMSIEEDIQSTSSQKKEIEMVNLALNPHRLLVASNVLAVGMERYYYSSVWRVFFRICVPSLCCMFSKWWTCYEPSYVSLSH